VDLRVGDFEGDVAEPLRLAEGPSPMDHLGGEVDSQRAPCRGHTRRISRRLAGPTADIEDAVVVTDAVGPAENLVVQPQLSVVIDEPIRVVIHVGLPINPERRHPARRVRGRPPPGSTVPQARRFT
jgi:hypothetical protein